MIDEDDIAAAARTADREAEELGLPGWCERHGIDLAGLSYVAQQRGLRAMLVNEGRQDELAPLDRGEAVPVAVSTEQTTQVAFFASLWIDGVAAGMTMYALKLMADSDAAFTINLSDEDAAWVRQAIRKMDETLPVGAHLATWPQTREKLVGILGAACPHCGVGPNEPHRIQCPVVLEEAERIKGGDDA